MEAKTWNSICTNLVEKFYQLNLKVGSNPKILDGRDYGYKSMSTIKYAEGFEDKTNLYEHTIEFANELYANGDVAPEEKLKEIIKETRTLVRNDLSTKVVATFLNTCLKLTNISPKFYFTPDEIDALEFDDKYDEENNYKVAEWMVAIVEKEYNK